MTSSMGVNLVQRVQRGEEERQSILVFRWEPTDKWLKGASASNVQTTEGKGKLFVKNVLGSDVRVIVLDHDKKREYRVGRWEGEVLAPEMELEITRTVRNGPLFTLKNTDACNLFVMAMPLTWDWKAWSSSVEWSVSLSRQTGVLTCIARRCWTEAIANRRCHIEKQGVSAAYLLYDFGNIAKGVSHLDDPNFHDLAPRVSYGTTGLGYGLQCPRDELPNCSIVDSLCRPCAGDATHFLSFAWACSFSTMWSALDSWLFTNDPSFKPQDTFLWTTFFCNNHFRLLEEHRSLVSPDLPSTLGERFVGIGRVLVLLDGWREPIYLRRVWCVFESYIASKVNVDVTVILPTVEAQSLEEEMNLCSISNGLSVDMVTAEATSRMDETCLKELVLAETSFQKVNEVVREALLRWLFHGSTSRISTEGAQSGVTWTSTAPIQSADASCEKRTNDATAGDWKHIQNTRTKALDIVDRSEEDKHRLLEFRWEYVDKWSKANECKPAQVLEGKGKGRLFARNIFGADLRLIVMDYDRKREYRVGKLEGEVFASETEVEITRTERNGPNFTFRNTDAHSLIVIAMPVGWDWTLFSDQSLEWLIVLSRKTGVVEWALERDWTKAAVNRRWHSQRKGVSVTYLLHDFGHLAGIASTGDDPTFQELAPHVSYGTTGLGYGLECPRDGRQNCSIVDALSKYSSGRATHFLSWAWGYTLSTMLSSLGAWSSSENEGLDAARNFLWICFFCNNQYRILEEKLGAGSDELTTTFGERLTDIGRVLVLLDTWRQPYYLRRLWCVFETYMAYQINADITVILPSVEALGLDEQITNGGLRDVIAAFQRIDIATATATVWLDEQRVKELILLNSSFDDVNTVVKDALVSWCTDRFESLMFKAAKTQSSKLQIGSISVPEDDKVSVRACASEWYAEMRRRYDLMQELHSEVMRSSNSLSALCGGLPHLETSLNKMAKLSANALLIDDDSIF